MSTIANMLIGSALESAGQTPDLAGSLQKGAALGLEMEKVQQSKVQLEQKKAELEMQKFEKVGGLFKTASEMKEGGAKKTFMKNVIPKTISALGLQEAFDPAVQEMLMVDPLLAASVAEEMRKPESKLTVADLKDPEKIASFAAARNLDAIALGKAVEANPEMIGDASKFREEEAGKTKRAEFEAQASMNKQVQGQEAAPIVEEKKKTRELHVAYKAAGGASGTKSRIAKLEEVKKALQDGKIKFGTLAKNIPYGSSLEVLARTDPDAKAAIDKIRSSINVKLRTGDPNPTASQIEQIYSQAIDPRLDNDANIAKLDAEIQAEKDAEANAVSQFQSAGIQVDLPSDKTKKPGEGAWKKTLAAQKKTVLGLTPEKQNKYVEGLSKMLSKPVSEIRKELGLK